MKLIAKVIDPSLGNEMQTELALRVKEHILVTLDFSPEHNSTFDYRKDIIKFNNPIAGWHPMVAKNLQNAEELISTYLGTNKAKTIMINTHGGLTSSGLVGIWTDNNSGASIQTAHLAMLRNNPNEIDHYPVAKADCEALTKLIEKVEDGGNFVFLACDSATNDGFIGSLQLLTGSRVNMYGFVESSTLHVFPITKDGNFTGVTYISMQHLLGRTLIHEKNLVKAAKLFPVGWADGDTSTTFSHISIVNSGVRTRT